MKQVLASIAVLIYFAFVTGVMVNFHYCMDRYDSFNLYKTSSDWCGKCGMHAKDNGCCHDEVKILKLEDDHQTSNLTFKFKSPEPLVAELPDFVVTIAENDRRVSYLNHSPPLLTGNDVYLQNRVFRI
jgi:hypothetical protein